MDILSFPGRDDKPARPATQAREVGVSEPVVRRCIQSIQLGNLDLGACLARGGAWAEAARRLRHAQLRTVMQRTASNIMQNVHPRYLDRAPQIIRDLAGSPELRLTDRDEEENDGNRADR